MRVLLTCVVLILSLYRENTFAAEDPDTLRKEGLDALRLSDTDPNSIVTAARKFGAAATLYDERGEERKSTEMNSFLYWCKKKMTSKNMDDFLNDAKGAGLAKKLEESAKPVAATEAKTYYERAEKFAHENPKEHLAIAIRYFEVADRFAGTPVSLEAQRKSLDAQQLALKDLQIAENEKPAAPSKTAAAKLPAGPLKSVDLIAMCDTKRDAFWGEWEVKDGKLTASSHKVNNSRIDFPYQPPAEYEYTVEFSKSDDNNFVIYASVGDKVIAWQVGHGKNNAFCSFGGNMNKKTEVNTHASLTDGKRHKAVVQVRKEGIMTILDGKVINNLKESDCDNMALLPKIDTGWWKIKPTTRIGLGGGVRSTTFYKVELKALSGEIKPLN